MSTPRSLQGSRWGSRSASTLMGFPSTVMLSLSAATVPGKRPSTLSYLSRWASISGVVVSLTATMSRSGERSLAARSTLRPMRPKPLMPTLTPMRGNLQSLMIHAGRAARPHRITVLTRGSDQAVEAPGHRRTAAACPFRQPRQVIVRMAGSQLGGLANRRRQRLPPRQVCLEQGDRLQLSNPRPRRAAEVRGFRVEAAVHAAANFADHPSGLEAQASRLGADGAERRTHRGSRSDRDHRTAPAKPAASADSERREVVDQTGGALFIGAPDLEIRFAIGANQAAGAEEGPTQTAAPAADARRLRLHDLRLDPHEHVLVPSSSSDA